MYWKAWLEDSNVVCKNALLCSSFCHISKNPWRRFENMWNRAFFILYAFCNKYSVLRKKKSCQSRHCKSSPTFLVSKCITCVCVCVCERERVLVILPSVIFFPLHLFLCSFSVDKGASAAGKVRFTSSNSLFVHVCVQTLRNPDDKVIT